MSSGYQVTNPNFFVTLNPQQNTEAQIQTLQATLLKPKPLYFVSTGTIEAHHLIGNLIVFTGAAANYLLPSGADVIQAFSDANLDIIGTQVYNVPETLRATISAVKAGNSFSTKFWNNSSGAVNVIFNGSYVLGGYEEGIGALTGVSLYIPTGECALINTTVVDTEQSYVFGTILCGLTDGVIG